MSRVVSGLCFASRELVEELMERGLLKIYGGYYKVLDDGSIEFSLDSTYFVLRPYILLVEYLLRAYSEELHKKCSPGRFRYVHEGLTIDFLMLMPVKIFYGIKHRSIVEFNVINPYIDKPGDVYFKVEGFRYIVIPPCGFVVATLEPTVEVSKDVALLITLPPELRWTGLQVFEVVSNFKGKPQLIIRNPTIMIYVLPTGAKVRGYVIPKVSKLEDLKKLNPFRNN